MEMLILHILRYICETLHDTHIYRGQQKVRYLSNLFSRNVYNLKGISLAFKNLSDFERHGQHCMHHGFRTVVESYCALRLQIEMLANYTK